MLEKNNMHWKKEATEIINFIQKPYQDKKMISC